MPTNELGPEVVRGKGAMHIVYITGAHERIRFGDLANHLNISEPTLSTRLDELEDAGLIDRAFFDEMPPRVEYSLTPAGEELYKHLVPLFEWTVEEYGAETEKQAVTSTSACGPNQ